MNDNGSAGGSYTMGYDEKFRQLLMRRNADSCAAHLRPHLEAGQRLLDIGCGPGTISVGLADAVAPGEMHGIDMEESQIELARSAAKAGDHENATFSSAQATALPFDDASFDVVHCHAVLMHIPENAGVLSEIRRVLRPGGLLSTREMIGGSCFFTPDPDGTLAQIWQGFSQLLRGNGGHPDIGKDMPAILYREGFTSVEASASFEAFSSPADVGFFHAFAGGWFFSDETRGAAIKYGLVTAEQFENWQSSFDSWKSVSGAFATLAWGEALARKV